MADKTLYVDNNNGNDSNPGSLLRPFKTLSAAYNSASPGAFIVLQSGFGSYGDLSISKDISVIGAYGASPSVGVFTITDGQCLFENIIFSDADRGIHVNNSSYGSISVKECTFPTAETAIELNNVNYASIHRNYFNSFKYGIKIIDAKEVNVSSNIFNDGFRSIEVTTVERLDVWRNTIYGASDIGTVITPDINLRVIYRKLTALNISSKRVALPSFATENEFGYDVVVNVVEGPSFEYGVDYQVNNTGSLVEWDGLALDGQLRVGDVLRVMYSEDVNPGSGTAIFANNVTDSNSTIDSNNITGTLGSDISLGVFFNSPLKIRYNNFNRTTSWYNTTVSPTDATGNFSDDPLYTNPGTDFHLQAGSPDIDRGDPDRWNNIYNEITGIGSRVNISPFNRDIDIEGRHRYKADLSGDIGSYEYYSDSYVGDAYVGEQGYDFAYNGSISKPFGTIDRGFAYSYGDDIFVGINPIIATGTGAAVIPNRYGRYRSQNLNLSTKDLSFGLNSKYEVVYLYPSFPSYSTGAVFVTTTGSDISGDGSQDNSYRTIGKALTEPASFIIVEPGLYPKFTGVASKRIIGVPKTYPINLGKRLYEYSPNDWSMNNVTRASNIYNFYNQSEMNSYFQVSGNIEIGAVLNLNHDAFTFEVKNSLLAFIQIFLERISGQLSIKFKISTPSSSYTYINLVSVSDLKAYEKIMLKIKIDDTKALAIARNSYFNKQKTMYFDSDPGYMNINMESPISGGTNTLKSLSIKANNFSAGSSTNVANIRRKIIGLLSDTSYGT